MCEYCEDHTSHVEVPSWLTNELDYFVNFSRELSDETATEGCLPPERELPRQLAQTGPRTRAKACPCHVSRCVGGTEGFSGYASAMEENPT
ncbi:hypothetical protein RR46_02024 [Papilio xuthus]|uniref:Uncharacterized protein n=1 Tax=Papilio xuthus TaxID=66420 RepID=A0A194QIP4_PAPXU|nr:hypothetical protein RR46_02024 [Papilio xuthus]